MRKTNILDSFAINVFCAFTTAKGDKMDLGIRVPETKLIIVGTFGAILHPKQTCLIVLCAPIGCNWARDASGEEWEQVKV